MRFTIRVIDADKKPVPDALVNLLGTHYSSRTNETGESLFHVRCRWFKEVSNFQGKLVEFRVISLNKTTPAVGDVLYDGARFVDDVGYTGTYFTVTVPYRSGTRVEGPSLRIAEEAAKNVSKALEVVQTSSEKSDFARNISVISLGLGALSFPYAVKRHKENLALKIPRLELKTLGTGPDGTSFNLVNVGDSMASNVSVTVSAGCARGGTHSEAVLKPGDEMHAGRVQIERPREVKIIYDLVYDDPLKKGKKVRETKQFEYPPPT